MRHIRDYKFKSYFLLYIFAAFTLLTMDASAIVNKVTGLQLKDGRQLFLLHDFHDFQRDTMQAAMGRDFQADYQHRLHVEGDSIVEYLVEEAGSPGRKIEILVEAFVSEKADQSKSRLIPDSWFRLKPHFHRITPEQYSFYAYLQHALAERVAVLEVDLSAGTSVAMEISSFEVRAAEEIRWMRQMGADPTDVKRNIFWRELVENYATSTLYIQNEKKLQKLTSQLEGLCSQTGMAHIRGKIEGHRSNFIAYVEKQRDSGSADFQTDHVLPFLSFKCDLEALLAILVNEGNMKILLAGSAHCDTIRELLEKEEKIRTCEMEDVFSLAFMDEKDAFDLNTKYAHTISSTDLAQHNIKTKIRTMQAKFQPHCATCLHLVSEASHSKCPCGTVRYCNKECQVKHWPTHRKKVVHPKVPKKD